MQAVTGELGHLKLPTLEVKHHAYRRKGSAVLDSLLEKLDHSKAKDLLYDNRNIYSCCFGIAFVCGAPPSRREASRRYIMGGVFSRYHIS